MREREIERDKDTKRKHFMAVIGTFNSVYFPYTQFTIHVHTRASSERKKIIKFNNKNQSINIFLFGRGNHLNE